MTLNRREAETGFGDEIPRRGMGWQPHRNPVTPKCEAPKSKNQGAKRNLIPNKLLLTHRNPVTPALGRAPQGG